MRIVAGKFRGKILQSPSDDSIRPTSDRARESIFNIIGSRLGPNLGGVRVLDLFAGTGALGLEALSRGAAHVTFVDTGAEARGIIRDHIEAFGAAGITKLLRRDATALGTPGTFGQFDLVFLDPPYAEVFLENSLKTISQIDILSDSGIIITERPFGKELPAIVPGLVRYRDYRYGKAAVTIYRREIPQEEA